MFGLKVGLGIFGIIVVILILKLIISNGKTSRLHKNIFEKGTLRYGTVVGYMGNCSGQERSRFNDESEDHIYNGGNDDEVSYTAVVLLVTNSNGTDSEVIIEDYGVESREDVLLSKRFPMGMNVGFYEYENERRFATDKWLAK